MTIAVDLVSKATKRTNWANQSTYFWNLCVNGGMKV